MAKSGRFESEAVRHVVDGRLEYLQFKNLLKYSSVMTHCFTTRKGGVSSGECGTLNLGFNRNDSRENVKANFGILAAALDIECGNMVFSNQVHDNKIKIVGHEDRGKGILRESDILGYDGLMTSDRGVALVTFYADCVPVFLFDPVKGVIALVHSGWRGTIKEIARCSVELMTEAYGCLPADIEAAVGPSICKCCYEVGNEVYGMFKAAFSFIDSYAARKDEEKVFIDLQGIISRMLKNAGLQENKICNSGICTMCNRDVFFSHRGDKGKTGSLCAVMELIESEH